MNATLVAYYERSLSQLRVMLACASAETRPYWAAEVAQVEARIREITYPVRLQEAA